MFNLPIQIAQAVFSLGLISSVVTAGAFQTASTGVSDASAQTAVVEQQVADRAGKIDKYFKDHEMPLFSQGKEFVLAAEANELDWRLLPAIAVQESTGGLQACHSDRFNVFGWASCNTDDYKKFSSYKDAIWTIASHLGGNKESTKDYYDGGTTREILYSYNGSVRHDYIDEVVAKMNTISSVK